MENVITIMKDDRRSDERLSAPTRELAQRVNGRIEVLLLWYPESDRVEVSVRDATTGTGFQIEVPPADAIEAFYHPYAYAARLERADGVERDEAAIVDG